MITLYMKNRPWSGEPKCDYVRVVSQHPLQVEGYRINGSEKLTAEPTEPGYLKKHGGWYHPATAWEIEEYRRLGGTL